MATAPNPHLTLSTSSSPSQKSDADVRLSAIDIGSNSIRQTIADVSPSGIIRVVDELKDRYPDGIPDAYGADARRVADAFDDALAQCR